MQELILASFACAGPSGHREPSWSRRKIACRDFLGPGHVCAVMGYDEYEPISARFRVPIVVTGFEPLDILQGTLMTIRQLETARAEVENQYSRVLDRKGNLVAQNLVSQVFEIGDRNWRGIGSYSDERLSSAL